MLHSIILDFQWIDILGGQALVCLCAFLAACHDTRHKAYPQQSPNVLVDYKERGEFWHLFEIYALKYMMLHIILEVENYGHVFYSFLM